MAVKLGRNEFPAGHSADDFKGFGPVVTEDTKWGDACLFDGGCFKQGEVDSNKYYHIAVVESKINGKWFTYFEYGRTKPDGRPNKPSFQFTDCGSKQEAQAVAEKQFHAKNTKRGKWEKIGSKQRFVGKDPKKDVYVVRATATRMVGLPCCENIANEDAKGANAAKAAPKKKATRKKKAAPKHDPQTRKLFSDLVGGAVTYANAMMTGGSGKATLPTQDSLDYGRELLDDAMARLKVVGDDHNDQVNDRDLKLLTYDLYGRIPKAKPIGAAESTWILSSNNIAVWRLDIDALETALQGQEIDIEEDTTDPLQGIPADVRYIPKTDELYEFFIGDWGGSTAGHSGWWPTATRYKSGTGRSKLKVHNLWEVQRHGDRATVRANQEKVLGEMGKKWNNERPMFHDKLKKRPDLNTAERRLFWGTNTGLLFHGTRSVNVPGIVRENLRFPKELTGVQITGAMFGPGSYFADDWSKSAGYCSHPRSIWGGGGQVRGRKSFMFAFDVVLGHPHVAPGPRGYAGPPKGHHCVFGKAGHSHVQNNEWIIYHKGYCEMRYLAEIEW